MKRVFLTVTAIALTALFAVAQNVPRDKVIVEIGTGTWCQYCPGSAMGADDLIANGLGDLNESAIVELFRRPTDGRWPTTAEPAPDWALTQA